MKLAGLKSLKNAHEESIWSLAWVPATKSRPSLLLSGSLDESVKLWKPDGLVPAGSHSGHCLGVISLAAHPNGSIAASASQDSFVRVFDVDTGAILATLEAPPFLLWQLKFDPQGKFLAVAGGDSLSIKIWETAKWELIDTLSVPVLKPDVATLASDKSEADKFVLSVAWSPDGKRLACGSMDGTISVFDVGRAEFLHHLEGHFMSVRSLAFSPLDPKLLFSASDDAHVHMYDAEAKTLAATMSGHSAGVFSLDVSPEGALATGSSDSTVKLWDLTTRSAVQTMNKHTEPVWGVAFRPSQGPAGVRAGRLASVSDDQSISLYDFS